jgi:hypothetical protein
MMVMVLVVMLLQEHGLLLQDALLLQVLGC